VDGRIAGVREALARNGIQPPPNWVRLGNLTDIKFVRYLIAGGGAEAFICANDNTAAVLMRAIESEGFHVPRNFRVVGFDDVKYATLVSPPLTTIHQPCRELGMMAFRMMLERIAEPTLPPRSVMLSPYLVVRESCGAYLSSSKPSVSVRT
jgi:LacI family transcriptional regulator